MDQFTDDELKEVFDVFAFEGTEFITAVSLKRVMTSLGEKLTSDEINAMMKEADANNDGKISFEEFKKIIVSS